MPQSTLEFLPRLRKFVQDEAETQFRALSRQWSHPLQERVGRGWAIEGLHVTHFQNGIVRLTCTTNDSRFLEGDLVVLHRGNPQDENAQHCELQYDDETELEISLIWGNEYFLSQQSGDWIMDQDWFDSSPFYLSALDTVADSQLGRSVILPLIQGSLTPKIDYARYERAREMLNDSSLNESQIEAVAMSYATDPLTDLLALSGLKTETLYRVFSVRIFNDSKRFNELKSAIVRQVRYANPEWKTLTAEDILRELNLVANPNYIHMAGNWQFTIKSGEILSLGGFTPSVGFPLLKSKPSSLSQSMPTPFSTSKT